MVKFLIILIGLLLSSCGSRELNLNSLDLNRYTKNLSESQEHFPAYVKLMTPAENRQGVVHAEIEQILNFFSNKSVAKQLVLLGEPGPETDARLYAMALHDKNSRLIELCMDKLAIDAHNQAWTNVEYRRVVMEILKNNHTENTVFVLRTLGDMPVELLDDYPAIIAMTYREYARTDLASKPHVSTEPIPLLELIDYAEKLDHDQAISAVLLAFAFLPGHSALGVTHAVLKAKPASERELVNHVFAQYQAQDSTGKNNADIKSEMENFISDMSSEEKIGQAVQNMIKFRFYYAEHHKMKHLSYVVRKEFEPELKGLAENQNLLVERLAEYFQGVSENAKKWTGKF